MKRRFFTLLITMIMTFTMAFTAFAAGWTQDSVGWWYDNGDGTYKINEWFTEADGKAYYFGADGYMMTNAYTPDGYWVGPDGVCVQGQTASSGQSAQIVTRSSGAQTPVPANSTDGSHYVLNTNTKKFHYPSCSSASDIKAGNRKDVTTTREEIINSGYKPCGRCNP